MEIDVLPLEQALLVRIKHSILRLILFSVPIDAEFDLAGSDKLEAAKKDLLLMLPAVETEAVKADFILTAFRVFPDIYFERFFPHFLVCHGAFQSNNLTVLVPWCSKRQYVLKTTTVQNKCL